MGSACSIHGREEKCIQNFDGRRLNIRDQVEDLGIDGKTI
jgi:hypothetical protein